MNTAEIQTALRYLTDKERAELEALLAADLADKPWRPLPGPQSMAYESLADITGYGGAAGGGKTDLLAGLVTTRHKRALVVRREKAQTEGVVQRLAEILGSTDGLNSQKGIWQLGSGRLLELAGLDNPTDHTRWQGRPHDLKAFDEVTEQREHQVRFVMGWTRTNDPTIRPRVLMTFNPPTTSEGRWVIDFFGPWIDKKHPLYPTPPGALRYAAMLPDGTGSSRDVWVDHEGKPLTGEPFVLEGTRVVYDFDPLAYRPEDIITPKSRTFIPARLTDNPYYMATGYMSTLQSLPEPLRSQMLYGDFQAGISDDPWQVIPTAWVEAAQARWKPRAPRGEMLAMGVDVARGGKDKTTVATRHKTEDHDWWFDKLLALPGTDTPDGNASAALALANRRDDAPVMVDVIGVGASTYDVLRGSGAQVLGVNVAEKATTTDRSGRLTFFNLRSQLWWRFRELLDPAADTGVALPPDPELLGDLTAPKWELSGMTIKVESREQIIERIGRSPDRGTAVLLAAMEVPKLRALRIATGQQDVLDYDPLAGLR